MLRWLTRVPLSGLLLALPLLAAFAALSTVADTPVGMELKNGILTPKPILTEGQEPATGLQRPFPPVPTRPDNPTTPERVELGRLLFFDPILSGDNKMSCAHCHHPNLGFSDGQARAHGFGSGGVAAAQGTGILLARHTPTLWNALYNPRQYWDGRAKDLEDQAQFPITATDEMGEKPENVVRKLKAIPEYQRLFQRAFGGKPGEAITFPNVTNAIAAFERTFVSCNSRYDAFVAGDAQALTPSEVRGLKLFLSTKLRCAECHGLPTFANPDFKVIGVPDAPDAPDPHKPTAEPGHGGGPNGAFKIPTLRNIALHAPYMHNGTLKTLDDVLEFYEHGGGRGKGLDVPLQDDKIRKYKFLPGEKKDVIAFLNTLTDTSAIPRIPRQVPSGLLVTPHVGMRFGEPHTARPIITAAPTPQAARRTIEVRAGQSIQEAVEKAGRGGTVKVYPGVYHEDVLVIHHDVTLLGVSENGQRPVLDGRGELSDAVVAMGNRFAITGFEIRDYQGNGVVAHEVKGIVFRDLVVKNPGVYAVYPVGCEGVTVEKCVVSGAKDAGIYVGQSRQIVVRDNEVFQSVAGIEIENSSEARVENNNVHDNTGGILVFVLPFNPSKKGENCRVAYNRIVHNNVPNFGDPNAFVRNVLSGTGITVLAADRTEITENEIADNATYGIAVANLRPFFPPNTRFDVEPNPDETRIYGNTLKNNGTMPEERLKKFGVPGRDLLWDFSGQGNVWDQPGATAFPNKLPAKK